MCPDARHRVNDVIATAARGDPPALAQLARQLGHIEGVLALPVHRQAQVRELVALVAVAAVLGHDDVRFEGASHGHHD